MKRQPFPLYGTERETQKVLSGLQNRYHHELTTRGMGNARKDLVRAKWMHKMERQMAFYHWLLEDFTARRSSVVQERAVKDLLSMFN